MNYDQANTIYQENLNELKPVIEKALEQILQRKVSVTANLNEETEPKEAVLTDSYPAVCLSFTTGSNGSSVINTFLLPIQFALQFYAWMISDEPADSLSEDHLEGLKEAIEQVFGQIKMSVADEQAAFQMENMELFFTESSEKVLEHVIETPAIKSGLEFKADDTTFPLIHYCWITGAVDENSDKEVEMNDQALLDEMTDPVDVQPAEFGSLVGSGAALDDDSPRNVDMLMDVDLEVTVELDRKTILVSELLKLGKGSIVELDKSAGEPLDIFVNGRKFAEGEVVVIDDKFGIRITQLISPKERVKTLG